MPESYRFGEVDICADERRVTINGLPRPLRARAFDLLLALVERRDRVVHRDELHDVVWGDRVVEVNNLAVQVHALRKVLGEHAIETVPGRGYRFALHALEDRKTRLAPAPGDAPAGALPLLVPTLLGRDDDLAALDRLLMQHRLVSVIGGGGIGKTVLALAAAHARRNAQPDGAVWVELAQIVDPALLASTVARAFDLPVAGGDDPLRSLVAALESTRALVVLDNAEHLIEAVARFAAALLARAPGMRILVTSQTAVRIDGEHVFRLSALAVPEAGTTLDEAANHGAVALFVETASGVDRGFSLGQGNLAAVIGLCHHLDGIPLAIKLAAARVPFLGLHELHARIDDRLKLIVGGHRNAPARQQTLLAALEWSHGLLSDAEQRVFRRMAVFVGGFTLQFAIDVAKDEALDEAAVIEILSSLVDRSLVAVMDGDPPRYRLLESARAYALLQLDAASEAGEIHQRHAHVMRDWMSREEAAYWVTPELAWTPRIAPELDNVRAALDWSARRDAATAVAIVADAHRLFVSIGLSGEYLRRSAAIEPLLTPDVPASTAARYWLMRAQVHAGHDYARMHELAQKALAHYRRMEDAGGLYYALCVMIWSGRAPAEESRRLIEQVRQLERLGLPSKMLATGRTAQGQLHYFERRYAQAGRDFDMALTHARIAGALRLAAIAVGLRAMTHYAVGEIDQAVQLCRAAVAQERRRFGILIFPLGFLAVGLVLQSECAQARPVLTELFRLSRAAYWWLFQLFDEAYVLLAMAEGRHETAARLLGYVDHKARPRVDMKMAPTQMQTARAQLERRFGAASLQALLDEGALLDEEAVCALTLEAP